MSIRCRYLEHTPTLPAFAGRVAILIPCHNEARHLPALIEACRRARPRVVLIVDDASTDDTLAVIERSARDSDVEVRVLCNPKNLGKQGAVREGLRALAADDLDAVALIDGDGQHDPLELPGLASLLEEHDAVIGVRSTAQMPLHRRASNALVNLGFRVLAGVEFYDVQSGLRLYRKPLADLLGQELSVAGGYGLEHESLAVLARHAAACGRPLEIAAAPIRCTYGASRSQMRPGQMARLAVQTVQQALCIRRALRHPPAPQRALTVEIHDITPASFAEVRAIREQLAAQGVTRPTLLVVPCYVDAEHRAWDLRDDPGLVEWLRREQAAGAEIVQHGLTHLAAEPPPPGVRATIMHRWFSRGCAEFAHLSRAEAARRLERGRQILLACGLRPNGFVAPAWLQSPGSLDAVAGAGYRFTAFLTKVLPLGEGERPLHTPALTFAAPAPLVDYGKRLVMRGLEAIARPAPLLRVAVHPDDVHGARPLGHISRRVRKLLRHRRLVTYGEWLAEQQDRAAA